eukprot:Nitzschia sp. Nitz4//scaffold215_size37433//18808//20649//NITZ4_007752-RA/size37433-augustus-gene-0.36-mRNA-1//-1//CDS//3329542154//8577//frame0
MAWSYSQQVALAVTPKISSVLSFAGSTWIIIEILTDRHVSKPKWRNPYHRLILGMSIYDVLESIFNFLSTWPIPKGTKDIAWAIGNEATCTAQGFFLMLGIAIPIYNACLSLYYVLVINFQYTDTQLRLWVEPSMHLVAFAWGFGTALSASVMKLMNNANLWCWIAPLPVDCVNTLGKNGEAEPNCERGNNAWLYRWIYYLVPLWSCIFFATICLVMVYRYVSKLDHETVQYRSRASTLSVSRAMATASNWASQSNRESTDHNGFDFEDDEGETESPDETKVDDSETNKGNDDDGSSLHASFRVDMTGTMAGGDSSTSEENDETVNNATEASTNEHSATSKQAEVSVSIMVDPIPEDSVHLGAVDDLFEKGQQEVKRSSCLKNPTHKRGLSDGTTNSSRVDWGPELDESNRSATIDEEQAREMRGESFRYSLRQMMKSWRTSRSMYVRDYRRTLEVFHQALFYLGTFYMTHFWSTTNRITQQVVGRVPFPMLLLHSFFDPLQGFLNYFVYQRPRYLDMRRKHPNEGRIGALYRILLFTYMSKSESTTIFSSNNKRGSRMSGSRQSRELTQGGGDRKSTEDTM